MKTKEKIENYFRDINKASMVYLLSDEIKTAIEHGYIEDTNENRNLIDAFDDIKELAEKKDIDYHYLSCRIAEEKNK